MQFVGGKVVVLKNDVRMNTDLLGSALVGYVSRYADTRSSFEFRCHCCSVLTMHKQFLRYTNDKISSNSCFESYQEAASFDHKTVGDADSLAIFDHKALPVKTQLRLMLITA